jgi:hypothetical protein
VSPGDYWFSVVDAEAGETPGQRFPDNNGVIPERSLGKAELMWQDLYEKKFKVSSFVSVYSEIIDENYGFEGFHWALMDCPRHDKFMKMVDALVVQLSRRSYRRHVLTVTRTYQRSPFFFFLVIGNVVDL